MPSKFIGIRLPEEILSKLEKIAQSSNQTPNQLAKIAILEWMESNWTRSSDMITVTRSSYSKLLKMTDDDQLKSIESDIAERVIGFYEYSIQENADFSHLEAFLKMMCKFIGTKTGLQWFRQLDYEVLNKPYYFKGTHDMGKKWSDFFLGTIRQIMAKRSFSFELIDEKIICSERMVYLEFNKK